jgi:hypothetical protein
MNAQATSPSLLAQFDFGFTPSPLLANFLKRGDELWKEFAQFEEGIFWSDQFCPTGSVIHYGNGLTGIVVRSDEHPLIYLLVPDLLLGRWERASVPSDRMMITVSHAPDPTTPKEQLLKQALSAIAAELFDPADYARDNEEFVKGLPPEQCELFFLLNDVNTLIALLGLWRSNEPNRDAHPFPESIRERVTIEGLLHRVQKEDMNDPLTAFLFTQYAFEFKDKRLQTQLQGLRENDWLVTKFTSLAHDDLWVFWDRLTALGRMNNWVQAAIQTHSNFFATLLNPAATASTNARRKR